MASCADFALRRGRTMSDENYEIEAPCRSCHGSGKCWHCWGQGCRYCGNSGICQGCCEDAAQSHYIGVTHEPDPDTEPVNTQRDSVWEAANVEARRRRRAK